MIEQLPPPGPGDTQEIIPPDFQNEFAKKPKKNPRQLLQQSVIFVARELNLLHRRESSEEDITDFPDEVNQVIDLVLEHWETYIQYARISVDHLRNSSKTTTAELYVEMSDHFNNRGLPSYTVNNPDEYRNNPLQLKVINGIWALTIDGNFLNTTITNKNSTSLIQEMMHEFFAWKLFSSGNETPDELLKSTKNKKIKPFQTEQEMEYSILQTHFFDELFKQVVIAIDRDELE